MALNLCRNCGSQVESAEFMDGAYLIHSDSTMIHCDDRKIVGDVAKKAELMTLETQADWVRYITEGVVIPVPKELMMKEEPSYMMFARANVRDDITTSPVIVKNLLARIDRLEAESGLIRED